MSEWISVKDQLPPMGVNVLAFRPAKGRYGWDAHMFTTKLIEYTGKVSMTWLDHDINKFVTHWMPLPSPPK